MVDRYWPNRDEAPYGVARLDDVYKPGDIFEKFPKHERKIFNYYGPITVGFMVGAGLIVLVNVCKNNSVLHTPWQTLGGEIFFAACGHYAYEYRQRALMRQEAICRDYMRLHPDRFPPVERKKFGDVLHQWHAKRWFN